MGTKSSGGAFGYCNRAGLTGACGYGTISDEDFTLDGEDYTVESIRWGEIQVGPDGGNVHLTLDQDFPETFRRRLALQVGTDSFQLLFAVRSNTFGDVSNNYRWLSAVTQALVDLDEDDTVTVKLIDTDATLSALTLTDENSNAIALTPTFESEWRSFTASVAYDVDEITIAPTANDGSADCCDFLDDTDTELTDADPDATGFQVALAEGANTIKVKVTARGGMATDTYTVVVTREAAASTDATLSALTLTDGNSNAIALTPTFASGTTSYTASVANGVSRITVAPTANDGNADCCDYLDGSDSVLTDADTNATGFQVDLDEGDNTIKVKVTAEDGTTTATYTVTVTRAGANTAPTVANAIPDQVATVDTAFSYAFPANTFEDADGDTLDYTATQADDSALPSWLGFTAGTRTFAGTPASTDVGTVSVKVTASDGTASVSDEFDIKVPATDVCDRTAAVRDAIVAAVSGVTDCADLTPAHLAAVTGTLELDQKSISSLAAGDFAGLTKLEVLDLFDNSLISLPPGIFNPLTALTELNLEANRLASLTDGIFDPLTVLQELNLEANRLASLPDDIFDDLAALDWLGLEGNRLSSLPDEIFDELTALTELDLTDNDLSSLPAGIFDQLTGLEILRLEDNDLSSLPADIFEELTTLTSLQLQGNPGAPFSPTASAGADQSVDGGASVTLAGTATGAWGDNVIWQWTQVESATSSILVTSGAVTLDDDMVAGPSFTAPATSATLYFRLVAMPHPGTDAAFGRAASAADWVTVTVTAVNNPPTVANAIPDQVATVDAPFSYAFPANTFEDADGDPLTYTATKDDDSALPDWLGFTAGTRTFAGTPASTDVGTVSVKVTASDGTASVSDEFDIKVPATDVCDRTPAVRDGIVAGVSGVSDCADLTPAHLAAYTHRLDLSGGGPFGILSSSIEAGDFDGLTGLRFLELDSNDLSSLPAGVFDDLAALEELSLSDNDLSSLPDDIFDKLTALKTLYLYDNSLLSSLPAGVFDELTGLEILWLRDNDLSTLPDDIFDPLTALTNSNLLLHNNPGAPFSPTAGAGADQSVVGGASVTLAGTVTGAWGDNVTWEWTQVNGPASNTEVTSGAVTLDDDEIAAPSFTAPAAATTLHFKLVVKPHPGADSSRGLARSTDWVTVNVAATDVCGRTPEVRDAIVGKVSGVTDCADLTPAQLAAITGLLDLGSASISSLAAGDFAGLTSLTVLFLNDNGLSTLPAGIFDGLAAVTELHMSDNGLTSLPANVFDDLTALEQMYLDNNSLSSLPANVFDELTALTLLYLDGNSLSSLPAGIFEELTALSSGRLRLQENPGAPFSPTASAGADRTVLTGASVTLAGAATGAWRSNVTWEWEQVDGPASNTAVTGGGAVTLDDDAIAGPSFTAPATATTLHFKLVVTPHPGADNARGLVSATDWVSISTTNAPTVANAIPDQTATVDTPFSYAFPTNTFEDADGDPLTYTATKPNDSALPSWLSFTAATRTFAGTPAVADAGTVRVKVTASDGTGSVSDTFDIKVATTDVCDRTAEVRDGIVAEVSGVSDCADVTPAHLAAIDELSLDQKNISSLTAGDFAGLTALEELFLGNNGLSSLPADIFDELAALEKLEMGNNSLSALPAGVFDELTSLTKLDLAFNSLSSLPAGIFDRLGNLEILLLLNNNLSSSSLPDDIFEPLTALTDLSLSQNPGATFRPTVSAGADQSVEPGESVTLPGTATGAWGDNVTWQWTQVDGPASNTAVTSGAVALSDDSIAAPSFTAPAATTLYFKLVVTPRPGGAGLDGGASATDRVTVTVTSTTDATLNALALTDADGDAIALTPPFAPTVNSYTASVVEAVDTVTVAATVNNSNASRDILDGSDATLTDADGNAPGFQVALATGANTVKVKVTAADDNTTDTYTVTVTRASADAPTVANPIPDQNAPVDVAFSYAFPADAFDDDDPLSYTATKADGNALPSWLSFTAATRTFAGTPAAANIGTVSVKVTASDGTESVSDEFDITVFDTAVCNRTDAVIDAILEEVPVSNCANVTDTHLAAIAELDVSDYDITSLKVGDFAGLTGLVDLFLYSNDLSALPAGIFDDLSALEYLDLDFNGLSSLPAGVFGKLVSLDELYLDNNSLSALPDDVFEPLTALTKLVLDANSGAPFRPTANAGADQSVEPGASVTLAGAATGAWGDNVTWEWTQVNGPASDAAVTSGAVTLDDDAVATPSFTAPATAATLHFKLEVTPHPGENFSEGRAISTADWVTVAVAAASTDATLSDLDLTWDDSGTDTAITLSPTFASATTSYTAGVANGVSRITVAPTVNDGNADCCDYLDGDDMALTDADTNATGFQVALAEGANTIKVKVTAADDNTTETYTVTVTRAGLRVWSSLLTVDAHSDGSRGFRNYAGVSFGTLGSDSFEYQGSTRQVRIVAAASLGVVFRTANGGDTFGGLVLEWAGETLPLDAATRTDSSFVWNQTWLDANASSLNAANYSATLPEDGTGNACLRTAMADCPSTDVSATTNNAPTVANAIPDQTAPAGAAFSYAFPADTFEDADGDNLTYTATKADDNALPSWLSFTASTRTFAGNPAAADVGTLSVKVTASDGAASVSDTFDITVTATDATLSDLDLTWDDGGTETAITLSPAFATATTSYTASVVSSVHRITVTPTFSDSNATVKYFDAADSELTDADSNAANGFQVNLAEGDNTIKVKVTAEDDTTTEIYEVTVTRALTPIVVGFDRGAYEVKENTATFTVTIEVTSPADGATRPFRLSLSTSDATAVAGDDYVAVSNQAIAYSGAQGEVSKSHQITIIGDTALEDDETFTATLTLASGSDVTISPATATITIEGRDAAGKPGITGTPQVGQTLTATKGDMADDDNLPSGTFPTGYTFQWVRVNSSNVETDISGATSSTYVPVAADVGNTIKVEVSFTDGGGAEERLASDATAAVMAATPTPTPSPGGTTYVSNLENATNSSLEFGTAKQAQVFSTGAQAGGYPLDSVGIHFESVHESSALNVELWSTTGTGANTVPDAKLFNLALPDSLTTASSTTLSFTAPDSTVLDPSTSYAVVVTRTTGGLGTVWKTSDLTETGLDGWSIADDYRRLSGSSWLSNSGPWMIAVKGTGTTPTASTDATLSGLGLTWDDGGTATDITLSQVFASNVTSYTASVANGVSQITVAPTANDSGAVCCDFLDDTDSALTDADTNTTGFQVDLDEGDNTIKVVVTAEDDNTTATYTVTVTRAGANTAPTVANAIPDQTAVADTAFSYAFPADTFEDADGDNLTYTATKADDSPLPIWLGFTAGNRTFSGTPAAADVGTVSVKVTASDGTASVSDEFDIKVAATDVCNRTAQVRDAIVAAVSGVDDCSDLTPAHLAAITGSLDFLNSGISSLDAGDFAGLTGLTALFLNLNGLSSLPAHIFDELTALKSLDLNLNSLSSLPADIFDELTALTSLDLGNNSLSSLPEGIFDELTALTVLQLQGNTGAPFSPTASAGADQTVVTGASVTLSGAATGAWGDNVIWQWTQVDGATSDTEVTGGAVTLDDDAIAAPSFTAPATAATLYFKLVVTPHPSANASEGRANGADWVTVTVASTDATLSDLDLTWDDGGTATAIALSPTFASATTSYTAGVANGVSRITVAPTANDSGADCCDFLDDTDSALTDADTNATGFQVDLDEGDNTIKVKVTAEDDNATETYTVTVTRAATNNAPTVANAIPDQAATVGDAFSYAFPADTFDDADGDPLTYTATRADDNALPSWLGFTAGTRTFAGTPASTDAGTLSVKVTASDGTASVSDTFDITVAATDATLSALALTDGDGNAITLTPTFASGTTAYTASVGNAVDTITIAPSVNDSNATDIILDGTDMELTDADTNKTGFQVALAEGANTIKVKVTTEDDNATETYTVTVTRAEVITVGYDPVAYEVTENGTSVTFTVKVSSPTGGAPRAFILSMSTVDGTAISPGDYNGVSGQSIQFNPGDVSRTHTISIIDDPDLEDDETFQSTLSLFSGSDVTISAPTATVTIEGRDATGAPGITGTPQVGQTLTATAGTMADGDNLPSGTFPTGHTFQWVRVNSSSNETDISGATSSTYVLAAADVGNTIKVKASFADGGGTEESLASDATAAVAASGSDTIALAVRTATVSGTSLVIVFDETLAPAASLANGAFAVKKTPAGGSEATVALTGSPSIDGATVTLTLGVAVASTDTQVKVSYATPTTGTGNRLEDGAGNAVASFTDEPVTNTTGSLWSTTLAIGDGNGRGFSSVASPAVGALGSDTFVHAGAAHRVRRVMATATGVTFETDGGGADFGGFVLEWAGEVLPLDAAQRSSSTFTWSQTWLGSHTYALTASLYERALPAGGIGRVCLRSAGQSCPPTLDLSFDATLSALALTWDDAGTETAVPLSPAFASGTTGYTASVANAASHITVTPTPTVGPVHAVTYVDAGGTVLGDADPGADGHQVALGVGANTITVKVRARDIFTTQTYTVVVTRAAPSGDAPSPALSALTLRDAAGDSVLALDPAFDAETLAYTATVGHLVERVTLAGTPNAEAERVEYLNPGGDAYLDMDLDTPELDFTLPVGTKTFDVKLTGTDGATERTYTLTVVRPERLTAWFSGLPDSHDGSTAFTFRIQFPEDLAGTQAEILASVAAALETDNTTTPGVANVGASLRAVDVTVTPSSAAPVRIHLRAAGDCNEAHSLCGASGKHFAGDFTRWVSTVDDARLRALWLTIPNDPTSWLDGSPAFDPDTLAYRAEVPEAVSGVRLSASPYTPGATVSFSGVTFADVGDRWDAGRYADVRLDPDRPVTVTATVTAADGTTEKVYTYTVERSGVRPVDPHIRSVTVTPVGGGVVTSSRLAGRTYSVWVSEDTTAVTVSAETVDRDVELQVRRISPGLPELGAGERLDVSGRPVTLVITLDGHNVPRFYLVHIYRGGKAGLSVADAVANEADPTMEFRVTLVPAATGPVTVGYATVSGTAVAGADYEATSGRLTFAAGESVRTVAVALLDDAVEDSGETFTLRLSNPSGAPLVDSEATGTIVNMEALEQQADPVALTPDPVALTAAFEDVPEEHDGTSVFTFRVRFSEAPAVSFRTLRDEALTATGGTVRRARRAVKGQNGLWDIHVEPAGNAAVTVALAATAPCGEPGAVCTADGKALANAPAVSVQGPPGLAVADAEVEEGPDTALAFAVTLSRASSFSVTVDYATADETATAGADYTATSGTLTFLAGETAKTVPVPVIDDVIDEGSETLTLTLANPSGGNAWLADATATGTIRNSDHMPRAWLARFGRTVADQVLDAVEGRMTAPRAAGSAVTLAGVRLGGEVDAEALEEHEAEARPEAFAEWMRGEEAEERAGLDSREVTARELLTGSSFAVTGGSAEGGFGAVWGRGAVTRFDGREGDLTLDGEVASAMVGADWTRGRTTAGLVLSHSRGEGGYRAPSGDGEVESTLTGLYPWGRYEASERLSVWGVAGYGAGTLTLTPDGKAAIETDVDLAMAAVGGRSVLAKAPAQGGLELAAVSDALVVRTTSEEVRESEARSLAAAAADVTRLRLGLEGTWRGIGTEGGGAFVPRFELGVRHDGGDAETGFGADIGAGVAWSDPSRGVRAELSVRGLVTHEAGGFGERGLAGSLAWDPAPDSDRGPSLTLRQTVGAQASGGMDALLRPETAGVFDAAGGEDESRRLEAKLGYGLALFGAGWTGTPELGLGLSESARETTLGWRLAEVRRSGLVFGLDVEGARRESEAAAPEHRLTLGFGWRLEGAGREEFEVRLEAQRHEASGGDRATEHRVGVTLSARW